ncbi:MAG TPA: ABC transporter permease subunit [Longimicrobiales bacterium]|nr:ABC transporter permease subunit [Longimicrobiales bacterium]
MSLAGDVRTVIWKEWQEMADHVAGSRAGLVGLGGLVLYFGVIAPYINGPHLVASALAVFQYPVLAAMLTVQPIVDAFAGERERHTLETLLASRLPDRAILFGKVASALAAASLATYVVYGLALVTARFAHGGQETAVPPGWVLLGVGLGVLLVPATFSAIGVFISLGAPTVRQAAQNFGLAILGLTLLPVVITQLSLQIRSAAAMRLSRLAPVQLVLLGAAALVLLATLFLTAAVRRFRRGRLNLD